MAQKLEHAVTVEIAQPDLCAILTSHFCAYGAFENLEVISVADEAGNFSLLLTPKTKEIK